MPEPFLAWQDYGSKNVRLSFSFIFQVFPVTAPETQSAKWQRNHEREIYEREMVSLGY